MALRSLARKGGRLTLLVAATAALSLAVAATPFAARRADLSKAPACAKGRHSTAARPCTAHKKVAAAVKEVPLPVCNQGQRSTAARPCITLADNGPPPNSGASSSGSSGASPAPAASSSTKPAAATTTTTTAATTPPLVGPHINSHLCQADNGVIFECAPIANWDPGNPTPGDYPQIQN
jgi:hypothetical protein